MCWLVFMFRSLYKQLCGGLLAILAKAKSHPTTAKQAVGLSHPFQQRLASRAGAQKLKRLLKTLRDGLPVEQGNMTKTASLNDTWSTRSQRSFPSEIIQGRTRGIAGAQPPEGYCQLLAFLCSHSFVRRIPDAISIIERTCRAKSALPK